jgi:outer membrane protein OmpA-like peptidoglycan-associated protein
MRSFCTNIFLAFFFLLSVNSFSQSKKLWLLNADEAFKKKDYATAAFYYREALDDTTILETFVMPYEVQIVNLKSKSWIKVPELSLKKKSKKDTASSAEPKKELLVSKYDYVIYQCATSYRLNADYRHAVDMYKICVDRKVYPDALYFYGISLMNLKRYDEALFALEAYVTGKGQNDSLLKIAQKKEASCYFALDTVNTKREISVKMFDTLVFNRGTSNFAPMYYLSPNKIIFTSARRGGVITDPEKQDSKYLCDLYYTELQDSIWQRPVNFGRPVNSALHEGAGYITPDEVMLFTRWSDVNRSEAFIYMAKMIDGKFFEAMKLGPNVNVQGYKSMHPYVNFDGTRLFYSSNRPGGKGGFDIWMCAIDENGVIGTPKNLGEPVNTAGDEVTPFFHAVSNTLFYSSNALPGLGGLDIFKSSFNVDDSVFALPKNVGAPINSSKDDAYFIMERTQMHGMFASDREDCPGGHCYDIYEFKNAPIRFDISGYVYDNETSQPIPGALITIKDIHGDMEPLFIVTDEKAHYFTELKPNLEIFMKAQKTTYFASMANRATKGLTETTHLEQDFWLAKIPAGEIEIEGIEYDFNKATLREKSKENLDKIVDLLKLNDNLSIEINAHTDSRGNDAYNERLSQARAQSCVDYLISKGIAKSRLIAKGWGEKQPLVPEADINRLPLKSPEWEAAHQKNRRTAFKVIGESNINIINKTS